MVTVALSCTSLEELEARISEQSAALRELPENAVVLSTIHSAKGLEWEAVLMVGVEDGVLPHVNNDDIEEERRVAYVGITRAKRILGLTYANVRYGQATAPSPFLRELAGKSPSVCIWTGPRAEVADERLPLLSDRERQRQRQRINEEASSQRPRSASGRARVHGADAAEVGDRSSRKKRNELPARHGHPWGAQDDDRLRTQFLRGEAIAAMAHAHQRKKGAIRSRLVKLGLLTETMSGQSD